MECKQTVYRDQASIRSNAQQPQEADKDDNQFLKWKTDLFQSGKLTDVTLSVDGVKLRSHKLVLAVSSPVFEAMFAHDMTEKLESHVQIKDIKVEVFQILLKYIYLEKIDAMTGLEDELLIVADKVSFYHLFIITKHKIIKLCYLLI